MKTYGRFELGGRRVRSVLLVRLSDAPKMVDADAVALDLRADRMENKGITAETLSAFVGRIGGSESGTPPALFALVPPAADTDALTLALSLIVPRQPDAILLCGATCGADVQKADVMLSVEEAKAGLTVGHTAILALAGDNPTGALSAASFAGKSKRLAGLAWNPEVLAECLGTSVATSSSPLPCGVATAGGLVLLGAASAGVAAIGWLDRDADADAADEACRSSLTDGFSAMICERPEQVATINRLLS